MKRRHGDDLRGASRLAIEATKGIAGVVETMHRRIASGPAILGKPLEGPASLVTKIAYTPVQKISGLVGTILDTALAQLSPFLGQSEPGPQREALVSALNGVVGDHLEATGNPLAIRMSLRRRTSDRDVSGKIVILVHGSSMNDRQWTRKGHDHGAALEKDRGYTPVYAHYNTGLHISTNGRELDAQIDALVESWPVPVSEIVIVAHSMGGLVARAACASAERAGHAWRTKHLRAIVFLGAPHHGAPLERHGNWAETLLGVHRYSAPLAALGKIRSAGVTDLRFGIVDDADWQGGDRFALGADPRRASALPSGVACYAIAAELSPGRSDGLVPVDSALGRHARADLHLAFDDDHTFLLSGAGHLDLLDRREVYDRILAWLDAPRGDGA